MLRGMGRIYSRVFRLLKIISLVQSQRNLTRADLAKLCEVHVRTFDRDIVTLNDSGIPCGFNREEQRYEIGRGFFMPPVDLTTEEALALIALAEQVSRPTNIPFMDAAARAVEKVRSQLPSSVLDALGPLDKRINIELARGMADDSPNKVYQQMRTAIAKKRALRCRYEANKNKGSTEACFILRPYGLWYCQRAWYVVGHRDDRNEVRRLKLNRFISIDPTDKPYGIPDDFDINADLGLAWRMIRGDQRHEIAIRFRQPFAETVSETRWHSTQQEEWSDDGRSIVLRFTVDGLDEIVWWVLGYGPGAEVLEPPELREKVKDLFTRAGSIYVAKETPTKNIKTKRRRD